MAVSNITVGGLAPVVENGRVRLFWSVNDPQSFNLFSTLGLNAVEIWRSTQNSFGTATKIAESRTRYLDSNVFPGATYFYWLRARDNSGNFGVLYPAVNGAQVPVPLGLSVNSLINGVVVATAAAGAVTISIKLPDGVSDPTPDNPASVQFTNAVGSVYFVPITGPASVVIAAGTTLYTQSPWFNGSFSSSMVTNLPFQLYLIAADKGDGTLVLALANPQGLPGIKDTFISGIGTLGQIDYSPRANNAAGVPSPTACRTIARLTWPGGLASYGAWTAPTATIPSGPGSLFPGDVVNRMVPWDFTTSIVNANSGSTTIPLNALPTWSNGDLLQNYGFNTGLVQPFNFVEQEILVGACYSVAAHLVLSLFNPGNGTSANAIKAVAEYVAGADQMKVVRLFDKRQAGVGNDCSSMSIRFGGNVAGTWRTAQTSTVSPILGNVSPGVMISATETQY